MAAVDAIVSAMQDDKITPRLTLVKGEFPLTIKRFPDGWFFVDCHKIPGLMLTGKDLEALREEARVLGPLLLKLNSHLIRR
jgi:hypothetical protein